MGNPWLQRRVLNYAHQGGAKEAPSSTLFAIRQAIANYRSALALGGTRSLPELFAAAGINFDFTERTLRPLMATLAGELQIGQRP